jgi:hypothetical protein
MTQPTPIRSVTVEEAKGMFAKNVDRWIAFMTAQNLRHGTFRIDSRGLHGDEVALEVGAHCDAFAARGYEVVSHSVVLLHVPNKGDTTITSLLVRASKAE